MGLCLGCVPEGLRMALGPEGYLCWVPQFRMYSPVLRFIIVRVAQSAWSHRIGVSRAVSQVLSAALGYLLWLCRVYHTALCWKVTPFVALCGKLLLPRPVYV